METSSVIPRLIICQRLVVEKDKQIVELKRKIFRLEEQIRVLTTNKKLKQSKKDKELHGLSPCFRKIVNELAIKENNNDGV